MNAPYYIIELHSYIRYLHTVVQCGVSRGQERLHFREVLLHQKTLKHICITDTLLESILTSIPTLTLYPTLLNSTNLFHDDHDYFAESALFEFKGRILRGQRSTEGPWAGGGVTSKKEGCDL